MPEYIVYRHGWDDVTQRQAQGLPEKMPVARIVARTAEQACEIATHLIAVSPQQHLTAEPAAAADAEEENIDRRVEALQEPPREC